MLRRMPQPQTQDTGIDVVNAPQDLLGDLYHRLLRARWRVTIGLIAGAVIAVNLVFGLVFLWTGGIANARPGSFSDAFFFSVQTMGTVGYGAMYPATLAAHLGVTAETIVALLVVALSTGLVFSKFSIPQGRLEFARNAVVFLNDGAPTLAIRLSNMRGNYIVDAAVTVTLVRAETTREGVFFYRMYDLRLARRRSPLLGRSWQVLHPISRNSPLYGATPESMRRDETELTVTVMGIDGTSSQTVYGSHTYDFSEVRFGARYSDMLSHKPDGRLELDYSKLHDTVPAAL